MPFMDNLHENNVGLSLKENINKLKGWGKESGGHFQSMSFPFKK